MHRGTVDNHMLIYLDSYSPKPFFGTFLNTNMSMICPNEYPILGTFTTQWYFFTAENVQILVKENFFLLFLQFAS